MSWYPCESEDCENGADVEGGLCSAHQTIDTLRAQLECAKKELAESQQYADRCTLELGKALAEIQRIKDGK